MHEVLNGQDTPHQPVDVCAKPRVPTWHEHMTPVVGCIGADTMPYECFGWPSIRRDPRALRLVEVDPCELKTSEGDEDSDTHR